MSGILATQGNFSDDFFTPPAQWDAGIGSLGGYNFQDRNSGGGTSEVFWSNVLVDGAQDFDVVVTSTASSVNLLIEEIDWDGATPDEQAAYVTKRVLLSDTFAANTTSATFRIVTDGPQIIRVQADTGSDIFTSALGSLNLRLLETAPVANGPATNEELFQANYADASAADPKATALIQPTDVQRSIDTDVYNLKDGPSLHVVEAIFGLGQLENLEPYNPATNKARVYFVRDDQPGLREGKNLLLKGYQIRDADPAVPVTCTFWSPS